MLERGKKKKSKGNVIYLFLAYERKAKLQNLASTGKITHTLSEGRRGY